MPKGFIKNFKKNNWRKTKRIEHNLIVLCAKRVNINLLNINLEDLIVYEGDGIIALNKPSGLLSIPDREGKEVSLKSILLGNYNEIYTIHRLDKDTSGIIVFAKTAEAHKYYGTQFVPQQNSSISRAAEKIYVGLVLGSVSDETGRIDIPIAENMAKRGSMLVHKRGKMAITDYKILKNFGIYTWMQFQILTGRTHQIRVHAKEIGHPIACDPLYGDRKPVYLSSFKQRFKLSKDALEERPLLNRLALHALRLTLKDESGNTISLEAPLSKDLRVTVAQLEKRC